MSKFWNTIIGIIIILLLLSGLFDLISWTLNWTIIGVLALLWLVSLYNGFVQLRVRAKEAWADIDVQLKRRYDLIPNLINTVKGYAAHEEGTFTKITEARSNAMQATGPAAKGAAENMLSGALKSLFAVSENYPDLKANENFLELQRELTDTENKIQSARRFYNTNVRDMNTAVQVFPSNIIAGVFSFSKMDFFELGAGEQDAREPVEVKF
ncbi:hypothetical protein COB55_01000 [Candidatus Wolfebacteria bacterium]|nr:MAG: hypothetical protein COB55_01000 [Candidatus Wolfebacteria bacterium]